MELVFQIFFTFFGFSLLLLGPFFDMIHIKSTNHVYVKPIKPALRR